MGTPPAPDPDPDALKRARERRGLSQSDVARLLGVPAVVAEDGASNGVRDRSPVRLWSVGPGVPKDNRGS